MDKDGHYTYSKIHTYYISMYSLSRHTVGQDCQKCKETSSPLADKQQKTGEHVENIKFS